MQGGVCALFRTLAIKMVSPRKCIPYPETGGYKYFHDFLCDVLLFLSSVQTNCSGFTDIDYPSLPSTLPSLGSLPHLGSIKHIPIPPELLQEFQSILTHKHTPDTHSPHINTCMIGCTLHFERFLVRNK